MDDDPIIAFTIRMEALSVELAQMQMLYESTLERYKAVFQRYQRKELSYASYEARLAEIFQGMSKEQWLATHKTTILSLMQKLDFFNRQIFFRIYGENALLEQLSTTPTAAKKLLRIPKAETTKEIKDFASLFDELEA